MNGLKSYAEKGKLVLNKKEIPMERARDRQERDRAIRRCEGSMLAVCYREDTAFRNEDRRPQHDRVAFDSTLAKLKLIVT